MIIKYTAFNKTKLVRVEEFHNMEDGGNYDEILWVERGEDYYALLSSDLRDKKVAIVTRENWLRGRVVT